MIFLWFLLPYDWESQVFGDLAWLTSRLGFRAQRHGRTSQNQKSRVRFGFGAENWWELSCFSSHSCCWKKIHCNLKSGQNRNQQRGSRWNRQTYCSLEFSLRDLARPLHLQPYMSKISISNRFKQKILQTCCAWTWEELFDINNSGLVDFIPLLWDV